MFNVLTHQSALILGYGGLIGPWIVFLGFVEMAKSVRMTEAQWEEQRRSFVYGNTAFENEHITREMVDRQAEAVKLRDGELTK